MVLVVRWISLVGVRSQIWKRSRNYVSRHRCTKRPPCEFVGEETHQLFLNTADT